MTADAVPVAATDLRALLALAVQRRERRHPNRVGLAVTRALAPYERARARRIAARGHVQLHLGSARNTKERWCNVDLVHVRPDLAWDLRRPLPFAEGSVDAIFSEHLFEYFPLRFALRVARDWHRVLRPGGILRVVVPDAGAYVAAYPDDEQGFIERNRPGRPTAMLAIQEVFLRYGNRIGYDFDTLALVLRAAGFADVERCEFGRSRMDACPDSWGSRNESLYAETVKEAAA